MIYLFKWYFMINSVKKAFCKTSETSQTMMKLMIKLISACSVECFELIFYEKQLLMKFSKY